MNTKYTTMWTTLAVTALTVTGCGDDDPAEFEVEGEQTADTNDTNNNDDENPDNTDGQGDDTTNDDDDNGEVFDDEGDGADTGDDEPGAGDQDDDADGVDEESSDSTETSEGPVGSEDALETVEYEIPDGDVEGTITLGLQHLEIRGDTLELFLTFTPEFDGDDTYSLFSLHDNQNAQTAVRLFDRDNHMAYQPMESDEGGVLQTDASGPQASSGDTLLYWATFAVPEDDIDTIDVGIPAAPEFEEVEIDWGDDEPGNADDSGDADDDQAGE